MTRARLALAAGLVAGAAPLAAQERLVGFRTLSPAPVFETWSLGDLTQPDPFGLAAVRVKSASQWSVPIVAVVPVGERWTVDLSGAYASGTVKLSERDQTLDTDSYSLSGLTDLKLRARGDIVGDRVAVTFGVNLPTGLTQLDREEYGALRVLAAPALAFATPALGAGAGGTAGVVVAREIVGWAWAAGASYEQRATFTPTTALAAGLSAADFKPGGAIHLSLGADGVVGSQGVTVNASADFFGADDLTLGGEGYAGGVGPSSRVKLGPTLTGELQWRVGTSRLRDLTVYAVDRYRSRFTRADSSIAGSSGNYLNFGVRGVLPTWRTAGVLVSLDGRHQTGLPVDNTLATAAAFIGGGTVGVVMERGRYLFQPFARAQFGSLDTAGERTSVRSFAGGVTLGARY